jgi:hypothetical protein
MTTFSLSVLGVMLKATVLLGLAWFLCRLSDWRRVATQRLILLTTVGLLLLLPLGAWIDLPLEWSFPRDVREPDSLSTGNANAGDVEPLRPSQGGVDLSLLWRWIERAKPSFDGESGESGWAVVGWVYLFGLGVACVRAGRAWRKLARFRSRLRGVDDEPLRTEVEEFARALGIDRRIDIRECDEPNLVATFGVLRHAIVLPPEWRNWSRDERRTALAHEVGHVARADFLVGIVSRFVGCLYFCHPLAHWLRRELAWQQEVDADGLAASVLGGRRIYRKSLAMLALRLPTEGGRPLALPLPTLTGSYLLRRFEMLRKTEANRLVSRWWKRGLVVLLCGFAVVLSALRGNADAKRGATDLGDLPPFEPRYLGADTKAIIAVRPCEFFAQPGTERFAKNLDAMARNALKAMRIELPESLKLENVEQIVTGCGLGTEGTGKPGSRSFSLGGESIFIRMKEKFDWLGFLLSLPFKGVVHQYGGEKVYELKPIPMLSPHPVGFYFPDDRSVVVTGLDDADTLKKRVEFFAAVREREAKPIWKTLNGAALALTVEGGKSDFVDKESAAAPELRELYASLDRYAVGVELGDDRPIRVILDAKKGTDTGRLSQQLDQLVTRGHALLQTRFEHVKDNPFSKPGITLSTGVRIEGQRLEWQGFSRLRAKDFAELFERGMQETK